MKKRVNITRDVESRRNIARGAGFSVPAASPDKTECHDTKNEESLPEGIPTSSAARNKKSRWTPAGKL